MRLIHGGDWAGYRQQYGHDAMDFSANVSPLGLPPELAQAIVDSLPYADRYPDPLCRELCAGIAQAEQVSSEWVLCGNGAADLIFRLALALRPQKALMPAPTFAEYASALTSVNCEVNRYFLSEGNNFLLTEAFLDAIDDSLDVVFLCQPNNPTGKLTDKALLLRILQKCASCHTRLVIDECFLDFLQDRQQITLTTQLAANDNLIVLKAFTKLYAMAGVRLGYALCSDAALLEKMRTSGQPWAVSTMAQAAGLAALRQTEYAERVRTLIAQQRPMLVNGLRALGLRVVDGSANYLLFYGPASLGDALKDRGVVIRDCSNYAGLDAGWYRTAVRTAPENERLLKTLKEILQ